MLIIEPTQWSGTRADLEAAVAAFVGAKAAHAQTVGVPAPTTAPIIEAVLAAGGVFQLRAEYDAANPPAPSPPLTVAQQLAATDKDMARVVEDLFAALKAKGVLVDADLPAAARDKIAQRAQLRAQL